MASTNLAPRLDLATTVSTGLAGGGGTGWGGGTGSGSTPSGSSMMAHPARKASSSISPDSSSSSGSSFKVVGSTGSATFQCHFSEKAATTGQAGPSSPRMCGQPSAPVPQPKAHLGGSSSGPRARFSQQRRRVGVSPSHASATVQRVCGGTFCPLRMPNHSRRSWAVPIFLMRRPRLARGWTLVTGVDFSHRSSSTHIGVDFSHRGVI